MLDSGRIGLQEGGEDVRGEFCREVNFQSLLYFFVKGRKNVKKKKKKEFN